MTSQKTTRPDPSPFARLLHQLLRTLRGDDAIDLDEETSMTMTEIHKLLTPVRRRAVLEALAEAEETWTPVSALCNHVASQEYGCPPEALDSDQRKRVYVALTQSHLPTLAEADVVVYVSETQHVALGVNFDEVWKSHQLLTRLLR